MLFRGTIFLLIPAVLFLTLAVFAGGDGPWIFGALALMLTCIAALAEWSVRRNARDEAAWRKEWEQAESQIEEIAPDGEEGPKPQSLGSLMAIALFWFGTVGFFYWGTRSRPDVTAYLDPALLLVALIGVGILYVLGRRRARIIAQDKGPAADVIRKS